MEGLTYAQLLERSRAVGAWAAAKGPSRSAWST